MHSALQSRWTAAALAVFLLSAGLWQYAVVSQAAEALSWYRDSSEWGGEELLHRLGADIDVSLHLPLSSILQGLFLNHVSFQARELWLAAASLIQVSLLFALGCQLGALPGGLISVGLWLLMGARGLLHDGGFLQFIYTLPVLSVALALAWRERSAGTRREGLFAVFLGASLMYRSALAFFPPCLVFRERARLALLPYLFLIPWLIMNWRLHGEFIPFEYKEADLNVVSGALGIVPTVSDWHPLAESVGAIDDDQTGRVLWWAAAEVARHPLRYALSVLSRATHILSWHPWLSLLGFFSAVFWRRKDGYKSTGLLAAYLLTVHCLMSVNRDYFYALWALLTTLTAGLFCRALPAGDPEKNPWIDRATGGFLSAGAVLALFLALGTAATVLRYNRDNPRFDSEIARHPEDPWLYRQRARRRLADGLRDPAVADLEISLALRPGDLHKRYDLAWARFIAGDAKDLLSLSEDDAKRLYGRASLDILLALHHAQQGRQILPRLHLDRARYFFREEASIGWMENERERQALQRLRSAQDIEFSRYAVKTALRYRRPDERLVILKRLEGLGMDGLQNSIAENRELSLEHARALMTTATRSEMLAFLARAEIAASGLKRRRLVAGLYQEAGECQRAIALLDKLIAEHPQDAPLFNDRGICLHRLKRAPEAVDNFRKALEIDSGLAEASLSLGAVYAEQARHREALEIYQQALARNPAPHYRALLLSSREDALRRVGNAPSRTD